MAANKVHPVSTQTMKKTALVVLALAAAGAYFWNQSGRQAALPFVSGSLRIRRRCQDLCQRHLYRPGDQRLLRHHADPGDRQRRQARRHQGAALSRHRGTSIAINSQALPMLRNEVIAAQSANVDIISGATLSSDAFIRSLNGALSKAG